MKASVEFIPYGEICSSLAKVQWRNLQRQGRRSQRWGTARRTPRRVFVSFSSDLDEGFKEVFQQRAAGGTRLLIFNEGTSTDRLLARMFDLRIRTPERCYVVEAKAGRGKSHFAATLCSLLERLGAGLEAGDSRERILDARIENGILQVVSPTFERLDVPLAAIPDFKTAASSKISQFEIDKDGAFIYWPELDVHLGWSQLRQVADPEAALKASQKSGEFNRRYGKAVQAFREKAGLKRSDINLSEKQLGRIEKGECRLTSNAIEALANAHKLEPNEYMAKLAEALE
jgi:Helix-turn-helix domain